MKLRYLTKSRFKLGLECETKLFYTGKKTEYVDDSVEDEFLLTLAEGGFQVGELAKYMLCDAPGSDTIVSLDYEESLAETARRLAAPHATVAEAAFRYENIFIRADIAVKDGNVLHLYEVKAKSWDDDADFWKTRGEGPAAEWREYLYDIAFQAYVVRNAYPRLTVKPYLVLANKGIDASVDGLNQMFKVVKDAAGRKSARARTGLQKVDVGADVLTAIPVHDEVRKIWDLEIEGKNGAKYSFEGFIQHLSEIYAADRREFTPPGKRCKGCQFGYASRNTVGQPLKNGFCECWRHCFNAGFDFSRDTVLNLWNFRKADNFIAAGTIYLSDLEEADVVAKGGDTQTRQWLQVQKVKDNDETPWLDRDGLADAMAEWEYPLHFIDFETSMAALPFNRGRHPYEQTAFQFSHHIMHADGRVMHAGQWLAEAGYFPNFDFVRALKRELDKDNGTIFRYAAHENTVLNQIYDQLEKSPEPDKDELMAWIKTITSRKKDKDKDEAGRQGARNMVDMLELVKTFHYDPYTHGSNSIKKVLPAVIHSSGMLREKYRQPVYGTGIMPSLNFCNKVWICAESANDPYQALPPLFDPEDPDQALANALEAASLEEDDGPIANGGAALAAYGKLQFEDVPDDYRRRLRAGLLRYCELDTLAMVMLCEYWKG